MLDQRRNVPTDFNFQKELPVINVLVIEDSDAQIELIRGMLSKGDAARFEVSVAQSLKDGLEQLASKPIDVVLLDLTLPDSNGLQSCISVSESAPMVAIVVLTGLDDEELAVSTLQHGAEDYLVKSEIVSQLLIRATRYAIERKRNKLELQTANDQLEVRVQERTAEIKKMQEAATARQEQLAHVARLDTLGEMASGLAHELNQPLMGIIGFTDHVLYMMDHDLGDTDKCRALIEDAGKEAKRAGKIIKRMRRLVAKRETQRTRSNLNKIVSETIPLIRPGFHVEIRQDLNNSIPRVLADEVQIQQVILNLARNAVQAMVEVAHNDRELLLTTGVIDGIVFVEVSDTGPGMSVEDLDRLFDPFFTRKPDGIGLGLSISRTIAEAHAGELSVRKNPLTGLTFRFELPASDPSPVPA